MQLVHTKNKQTSVHLHLKPKFDSELTHTVCIYAYRPLCSPASLWLCLSAVWRWSHSVLCVCMLLLKSLLAVKPKQ